MAELERKREKQFVQMDHHVIVSMTTRSHFMNLEWNTANSKLFASC